METGDLDMNVESILDDADIALLACGEPGTGENCQENRPLRPQNTRNCENRGGTWLVEE
jgi:hypothetical protein